MLGETRMLRIGNRETVRWSALCLAVVARALTVMQQRGNSASQLVNEWCSFLPLLNTQAPQTLAAVAQTQHTIFPTTRTTAVHV